MTVKTFQQTDLGTEGTKVDDNFAVLAGPAGAFAVHEQSTPDMTARVDAGVLAKGDGSVIEAAAQSTGTITAPSTDPRNDIVYIDLDAGTVGVVTGTEAASPADPEFPLGAMPVARINLTTSTTSITNAIVDDCRPGGNQPDRFEQLKHVTKGTSSDIKRNNAGELFVATEADLTFTLEASNDIGPFFIVWVKHDSTGDLTIATADASKIDGNDTLTLNPGEATLICRDGSNFRSIGIIGASGSGSGTVTSVATGTGLTGGPITTSGTISVSNGGIDTLQLADDAVTLAKLEDGTQGDILYYGASGVPTRLAAGTSGQFLKTQGSGANPVWADGSTGGLVLLEAPPSIGNVGYFDFGKDLLSTTYDHYLILFEGVSVVTDGVDMKFNFLSGSGGSTLEDDACYHWQIEGATNAGTDIRDQQASDTKIVLNGENSAAQIGTGTPHEGLHGQLWFHSRNAPTVARPRLIWHLSWSTDIGPSRPAFCVGSGTYYDQTNTITGFRVTPSSGNLDGGKIKLYGFVNS